LHVNLGCHVPANIKICITTIPKSYRFLHLIGFIVLIEVTAYMPKTLNFMFANTGQVFAKLHTCYVSVDMFNDRMTDWNIALMTD